MKSLELESRLVKMRPFEEGDCDSVFALARDKEIADNTFVPHPYTREDAREFIAKAREQWRLDEAYVFAIIEQSGGLFAGAMGLHPKAKHNSAEVGYWIGKPYWGRGLATSSLRLLIAFAFQQLKLNRIEAGHFADNEASGRVMRKAGMRREGLRRQAKLHRDAYKDVLWHAILREDFLSLAAHNPS